MGSSRSRPSLKLPEVGVKVMGRVRAKAADAARPAAEWVGPVLTIAAATAAFVWTLHTELLRLYGMTSSAWDLAYDQQVIWNISVGQGFYSSFARADFLGIHFEL